MVEHLSGYSARDREVVDYELYQLDDTGLFFRGPRQPNLPSGRYIACIGAAQTFGCFAEKPFPLLLEQQLGLPVLNLGFGGAGPGFFLRHKELWSYLNEASVVVVQVMSGRSVDNRLFEADGLEYLRRKRDGIRLGADAAYQAVLENDGRLRALSGNRIARALLRRLDRMIGQMRMRSVVRETRRQWSREFRQLLKLIGKPKLLFWFSQRSPHYEPDFRSAHALFSAFPQLVDGMMIREITPDADGYVECVSSRGMPQPLVSRFTGRPVTVNPALDRLDLGTGVWTTNNYYPSPEMHQDAATALAPALASLLSR